MFDCDDFKFDLKCPSCGFFSKFTLKQARFRDVIICRGCKVNIRLDDRMNECRIAVGSINQALSGLKQKFNGLNITLKI